MTTISASVNNWNCLDCLSEMGCERVVGAIGIGGTMGSFRNNKQTNNKIFAILYQSIKSNVRTATKEFWLNETIVMNQYKTNIWNIAKTITSGKQLQSLIHTDMTFYRRTCKFRIFATYYRLSILSQASFAPLDGFVRSNLNYWENGLPRYTNNNRKSSNTFRILLSRKSFAVHSSKHS